MYKIIFLTCALLLWFSSFVTLPSYATIDLADQEKLFWEDVKDSLDVEALELYLERYPSGEFVNLAQLKIKGIKDKGNSSTTGGTVGKPEATPAVQEDSSPVDSIESPNIRDIIVTGQGSPVNSRHKTRHQYTVRDGLTPQVILQLALKNKKTIHHVRDISKSWLGDLDCIYGHYTSPLGIEALVFSRDGDKCHADIYTHVWLFGLKDGQWSLMKNIGMWDFVEAQILDVNGDGLDEVMISGSGGNGFGYFEGVLYSLKENKLETLYKNEGHDGEYMPGCNHYFLPEYKHNILGRLYAVSFTSPDSDGIRTLIERQELFMGKRLSNDPKAELCGQFEENGKKYITNRFHLEKGLYRPIPHSAVTTEKAVEMETIMDTNVRISVPLGDH